MRKKTLILVLLALLLSGCGDDFKRISVNSNDFTLTKAVWFSYLDYSNFLKGKSEEEYTKAVYNMIENMDDLGINTVYFQVMAFGDAFYPSAYLPWSTYCCQSLNQGLTYDPLKIFISAADMREIEVEAWINPFRSLGISEIVRLNESFPIKRWYNSPDRALNMMEINGRYYLNPGSNEVVSTLKMIVAELMENYAISGIHISDPFYPEQISDEMDELSYHEYLEENEEISLEEYRRYCCDRFLREIYRTVHQDESLTLSLSVGGDPESDLAEHYFDSVKWMTHTGYCDMIIPRLEYGFEHEFYPFESTVDLWESRSNGRTELMFGLAAYKAGTEDESAGSGKNEWIENADVLSRQVAYVSRKRYYDGIALSGYGSMFVPAENISRQMVMELTKLRQIFTNE